MGRWMLLGAVALIALVTGIVVTGLPDSVPSDVLRSDISPPRTTTTLPQTTSRRTTTTSISTSTSTVPATTLAPSTARPRTTTAPTAAAPTTAPPTPTAPPRTTTTLTPAASVRVVIANAGEADDLAVRTAPVLRRLGYENVVISTANARESTTMVWYRRGMEQEARALAAAVGIADGQVRARPRGRITAGAEQGDLWLVVGHGRPPLIEAAML